MVAALLHRQPVSQKQRAKHEEPKEQKEFETNMGSSHPPGAYMQEPRKSHIWSRQVPTLLVLLPDLVTSAILNLAAAIGTAIPALPAIMMTSSSPRKDMTNSTQMMCTL